MSQAMMKMKGSRFLDSAATVPASRIAVALSDPRVQFAPLERMRQQQLGSRFLGAQPPK
jgi:hypothetical protein